MYDEPTMQESAPRDGGAGYNFDEDMANPFGSKKAVQNSPAGGGGMKQASIPNGGGGMGGGPPNFSNEFGEQAPVDQPEAGSQLIQCNTCERKFNAKALERHSKICVKVF